MSYTVPDRASGVEVTDNRDLCRYEARLSGALAGFVDYALLEDRVVMLHVEVKPPWRGRGIASTLAERALDDVISRGLLVTPVCPFIVGYLRLHPAYLTHVDASHRAQLEVAVPAPDNEGI